MINKLTKWCRFLFAIRATFLSRLQSTIGVLIGAIAIIAGQSAWATDYIRYVDDNNVGNAGDGQSWSTPYGVLQDAISEALYLTTVVFGHEDNTVTIHIAGGYYYPDRFNDSATGTNSRTESFSLLQRVTMKGHYRGLSAGTGQSPEDRVSTINSYLDGDIGSTLTDNSLHVVSATDSGINKDNCLLDGFTIQNGEATRTGTNENKGGGIFLNQASPQNPRLRHHQQHRHRRRRRHLLPRNRDRSGNPQLHDHLELGHRHGGRRRRHRRQSLRHRDQHPLSRQLRRQGGRRTEHR